VNGILLLEAGEWDIIARAKIVEGISEKANSKMKDSSVYVKIARGLHTGFVDEFVFFGVPISSIFHHIGIFFGLEDFIIGQIDGSSILMSYFLSSMVTGKRINP